MTPETKESSKSLTAREFIGSLTTPNPFNELETKNIILLMENYARLKCREQRLSCADRTTNVKDYHSVLFAPEPKLEL